MAISYSSAGDGDDESGEVGFDSSREEDEEGMSGLTARLLAEWKLSMLDKAEHEARSESSGAAVATDNGVGPSGSREGTVIERATGSGFGLVGDRSTASRVKPSPGRLEMASF